MTQKTVTICDHCGKNIAEDEKFINAGTYGIHLHLKCIEDLNALDLVAILDLDDIKLMVGEDWQGSEKLPSAVRRGKL